MFGDYDYDHPHAAEDDMRWLREYSEENVQKADDLANEKHELDELF